MLHRTGGHDKNLSPSRYELVRISLALSKTEIQNPSGLNEIEFYFTSISLEMSG